MTDTVTIIDESNSALLRRGCVLVDFYAPWCGPCKRLAPAFSRLSLACKGLAIVFAKVDGDDNEDLMEEYDVHAYPTVLLLSDGKVVNRVEGCDESELDELVERAKTLSSGNK